MRYILENENLTVEIDSFGAEIKSVKSRKDGREYMWNGDKKFWGRTSPVLFPFVGSCKNKEYSFGGKIYAMKQHGFARDNEHVLVSKTENEIWFRFESSSETKENYPFDFVLKIGYLLKGNSVKVMWAVENPSAEENLYFSIGAHPAFMCDFSDGGYSVQFSKNGKSLENISYHGLNEATGLALHENLSIALKDGCAELTSGFFDRCALIFEKEQADKVSLLSKDGTRFVTVSFDMPLFALWSPEGKHAPFVCIEPWCGRCDMEDFAGTLEEREYSRTLQPGKAFNQEYTVEFN